MPGTDLRKEATFGLNKVKVAAPYGPCCLVRRPYREGSRGVAAVGVFLLASLPPVGDSGPVRLLGVRRRWRGGDRYIISSERSRAVDRIPDSLGLLLVV